MLYFIFFVKRFRSSQVFVLFYCREVQKLRPLVRNTPEIKFVLQVYSALNTNNYVRFFRLVKRSSFSNACIMHRYFTQVRNRALTSMMRTYGIGNKPAQVTYPDKRIFYA